jgi:hypothetical protein
MVVILTLILARSCSPTDRHLPGRRSCALPAVVLSSDGSDRMLASGDLRRLWKSVPP